MTPTLFQSERGLPSVRFGPEALEDPIDPEDGARAFVRPDQLGGGDHVVVFGAGLGYRLRRLDELGAAPIVFEPCPDVLRLAREHGPGVPATTPVFTDPAALHQHLLRVSGPDDRTLLLCPPPYQRAFPDAYASVSRLIDEVQGLVLLRRNSIAERSAPMVEQAIVNLPRLASVPTLDGLGRPLDGVPAFLVAAGPSLDRNRHLLSAAAERGAVFAVNTSAPAIAAVGAPIDLLVVLEMLDVSRNMEVARDVTRAIALDVSAGRANYDVLDAPAVAYCGDATHYRWLADRIGTAPVGYGGSVATAAFALAARLGADPIVLLGQDLAYTGGRGYASDTLFDETTVRRDGRHLVIERVAAWEEITRSGGLKVPGKVRPCVDLPAWGGEGEVMSTHELVCFLRWFEGAARAMKGTRRLVNATEGGASIDGFEETPLAALLDELPPRSHGLAEALASAPALGPDGVRRAAREIADGSRALATAAKRCERALAKGDARALARATAAVGALAKEAPLVEAHVAGELAAILADEDLAPAPRERRTWGAIRSSAQRCADLARAAACEVD